jgi:hypothetical protein
MKLFQLAYTNFIKEVFKVNVKDLTMSSLMELSKKQTFEPSITLLHPTDIQSIAKVPCPLDILKTQADKDAYCKSKLSLNSPYPKAYCGGCPHKTSPLAKTCNAYYMD